MCFGLGITDGPSFEGGLLGGLFSECVVAGEKSRVRQVEQRATELARAKKGDQFMSAASQCEDGRSEPTEIQKRKSTIHHGTRRDMPLPSAGGERGRAFIRRKRVLSHVACPRRVPGNRRRAGTDRKPFVSWDRGSQMFEVDRARGRGCGVVRGERDQRFDLDRSRHHGGFVFGALACAASERRGFSERASGP